MNSVTRTTKESEVKMFKYKKRSGTSAITGHVYRLRLLSLILSRNLIDGNEFVLGCSVDDIGVMNEICFRFIPKDNKEKPVAVFIKSKCTGHITDDDLNKPKSAFHLYKCYQSHLLIKERFDNDPDALFEGKFNNVVPYFVIYTPQQSKITSPVAVLPDDKIYDSVNSIIRTSSNNIISKVQSDGLINDLINAKIEIIGKTIADFVTSEDRGEINKNMKNILMKYHRLLIPHIIKINTLDENCKKINKSLHKNNNGYIKYLKEVLFKEILSKSEVIEENASTNIQLLLETNKITADLLSKLIGTVIRFDKYNKKLVYIEGVSDFIKQKSIDHIQVKQSIVEEAFVIAGMIGLERIKISFNDLGLSEIITKQATENEDHNFQDVFEDEKLLAKRFLSHLYIFSYTKQSRETDLSERLKEEIVKSQATNKNTTMIFQNKPEAVLEEYHNKVQEWMLCMDKPEYLTNNCDFLKNITNIANPLLSILNYNCFMDLPGHSLKFNSKSYNSFLKLDDTQICTNITSNNVMLTCIKLMQYFSDKCCSFVNFDHVYNMQDMEFKILIQEINKTTIKTLVVIFNETKKYTTESVKYKQIISSFPNSIIAVSKKHVEGSEPIYDTIKGLEDIENANEVLKHKITIQGETVELGKIIDEKTIHFINAEILSKIIKNESIVLGKSLSNSSFNEIKDCYVNRKLCFNCHPDDLDCDNSNNGHLDPQKSLEGQGDCYDLLSSSSNSYKKVVAICGEPGMGKSTLLTHLSVKMKKAYPHIWIIKMNLLDYCKDFFEWEEKEVDVDLMKSLALVCRAELNHTVIDKFLALGTESDGGLVLLESKELDPIDLLHLNLIIHSFNTGNIIFLFDGFDEIFPHYETVVVKFIKNFVNKDNVQIDSYLSTQQTVHNYSTGNQFITDISSEAEIEFHVCIASRPYNAISTILKKEFNIKPLYLTQLSTKEQYHFYKMYWETNMQLEKLNSDQQSNVIAFYDYINKNQHDTRRFHSISKFNMMFCHMQQAAFLFLQYKANILVYHIHEEEHCFDEWVNLYLDEVVDFSLDDDLYLMKNQLIGIPLHMRILAELFVNEIIDTSSTKKWDMGVHTFEFYNRFLEIKVKKILFEEKGKENVNTSTSLTECEAWVEKKIEEHKKLAFYALFQSASSRFKKVISEIQWIKIQSLVEKIKRAEDKTGLIDRIHNGVPRFVHLVFAEYYAVEFIADMLKMSPLSNDQVYRHIDFVVNCLLKSSEGIMTAFNNKLKTDAVLLEVLDKDYTRKCVFTFWIEQDKIENDKEKRNKDVTLKNILASELIETAWILLASVRDELSSANIEKFVKTIESDFFEFAIKCDANELINYTLDAIRRVDPSMIVKALLNCDLQLGDLPDNELIISHLNKKWYVHKDYKPCNNCVRSGRININSGLFLDE